MKEPCLNRQKFRKKTCSIKNFTYLCKRKPINGTLAEWLGIGLQNRAQQFDSARYLQKKSPSSLRKALFIYIGITYYYQDSSDSAGAELSAFQPDCCPDDKTPDAPPNRGSIVVTQNSRGMNAGTDNYDGIPYPPSVS